MPSRIVCPIHAQPDCSPLLNGCGLVNWAHDVAAAARTEERERVVERIHDLERTTPGERSLLAILIDELAEAVHA